MPFLKFVSHHKIPLSFLLIYSFVTILSGLTQNVLQVDEGLDTFISTTILKYGYPRHSDGINHAMDFADIYDGPFIYRTWIPYYLQAASILVLGKTTLAARLPFAVCGILSVFSTYLLAWRLTEKKSIALLSAFFLASSVPAILYFQTARYIAVPILLSTLLLILYLELFQSRPWNYLPFSLVAIILFHTMFVAFGGLILGITLHFLMHRKQWGRDHYKRVGKAALTIIIFTLPWLIMISPMFQRIEEFYKVGSSLIDSSVFAYLKHAGAFLFQTNTYLFPFVLLIFFLGSTFRSRKFAVVLLGVCIGTSILAATTHSIPFFQYISATFPLFFILLSIIIVEAVPLPTVGKGVLVFIIVVSNFLHVGPLMPVKWLLDRDFKNPYWRGVAHTINREVSWRSVALDRIREIRHPVQGPLDRVVEFFKTHGKPGETCYIDNEINAFAFYSGFKMFYNEEMTSDSFPDWIVLRGEQVDLLSGKTKRSVFDKTLVEILEKNPYRKTILKSFPRRINNSYDIQLHYFSDPQESNEIFIFQLIK